MNETLQVAVRGTRADNRQRRLVNTGRRGHVHVRSRLFGDEDPVERQDDAVVVFDMRGEMVVARLSVMVIFDVRVGDHPVAVRPVGAVHVLHRGQRKDRQTRDEAQRQGAQHQTASTP